MAIGASHYFEDEISALSAQNLNTLGGPGNVYVSARGGLYVDVAPCRVREVGVQDIEFAGATEQSVTPSATNYIWLNSSGAVTKNTTGFPTYPGTVYYPLAKVYTDTTAITGIDDLRRLEA